MSCSDTDGWEVERDLRARLAEVEAAHSCAANLWAHEVAKVAEQRDRAEAAEARLAAVESERGIWQETARRFCQNADYWRERTEAAEARLAEVEWAEMLTGQSCEAGKHPDWFIDSEHNHPCPWCRLAEVEALCDEADRLGWHRNAGRKILAAARGEGDRG